MSHKWNNENILLKRVEPGTYMNTEIGKTIWAQKTLYAVRALRSTHKCSKCLTPLNATIGITLTAYRIRNYYLIYCAFFRLLLTNQNSTNKSLASKTITMQLRLYLKFWLKSMWVLIAPVSLKMFEFTVMLENIGDLFGLSLAYVGWSI